MNPRRTIRVQLDNDRQEKYEKLKGLWEETSTVGAVRKLLRDAHKLLENPKTKLTPVYKDLIEQFLKRPHSQTFHGIYNIDMFLNVAVGQWLSSRRADMSLEDMTFRLSLPDDERNIAILLYDAAEELSLEEICKMIDTMNSTEIKRVLEKFIDHDLVREVHRGNQVLYTAII
ncbi:MAG: hypothetical protein ACFFD4_35405 [Candidatus Odinarchaeota archaeon]